MSRVAIVTDSTSDLPADLVVRHGITVVPLNVHFDDEVFRDGVDLTTDDFLARLARSPTLPTTSQPAAGVFEAAFRRLAADHDAIVAVVISSKLSGTIGSATVARDAVRDLIPVEVVDSLGASLCLGFQVLHAAELAAGGLDAATIAARLRTETQRQRVVFFADTLEYLRRGGRIGKAKALVGSLLSLKPLLIIDEGQVVPLERARTRSHAVRGLIDFARGFSNPARLGVLHSTTPEEAAALAKQLATLNPVHEIVTGRFGPVILTHLGPGSMGVVIQEGEPAR
jgi:DegV family protein with EDD domain